MILGEIRIENVTKNFGNFKAVDNVSLTINNGELFSFLGPSGCGKTTILRMIAGFEMPTEGRIFIENQDITELPPYKRQVNTIFQNYSLFPHMSIFENVAFGLRIKKVPENEIKKQVHEMLNIVQMFEHKDKYPNEISGGQKQRIAIGRALINKPKVLLLDEPVAALDLKLRQRMIIELMNIHDLVGITFIYVTHDQGEAMSVSDRMTIMNKGQIVQTGQPGDIYERPNSIFSAYFIGDTNLISGEVVGIEDEFIEIETELEQDGQKIVLDSSCHLKVEVGEKVTLSLRPEKIAISRKQPNIKSDFNIIKGIVEDILYLGTHTQYIVRVGKHKFRVFNQHKRVYFDDVALDWEEEVYLFWHDIDSFVIEEQIPQVKESVK
ncbi:MAG TPA: ABC transporter ATP-binding protein [Candidatus Cloacimonadota bacterium]|nr:ABC transporter ATP-binding protein [Candidatus Cloacimonadota bacterium]HPK40459.1 ABC transporter ATP-binding protein [Candidatus Cloacimonadota bacterium]HPY95595.1 ABC transporter ATP-binding protein [Candidatus Cloacimonadota bacterium]HQB40163.1 ABC transporter ATP-binding protein [Candidatus Cloacimonadota bacterium]